MKTTSLFCYCIFLLCLYSNAQNDPIRVTVSGSGDPILLLSGFATNGDEAWQSTTELLTKDYECHIVNYAGFAGMEPVAFPWLPKVITAIEEYIKNRNLKKPIVIGHSLGGTIGIHLAANKELDISKLIIVDALPATGAMMMPDFKPERFQYESPYNDQMLAMNENEFTQMSLGMAAGMTSNVNGQKQIANWMQATDRKTYVYGYTDYLKFDVREDLRNISIPVTILGAGKPYGVETARANYTNQYQNLQQYDLKMNEDSAHFIMMDQPEWFLEQIQIALK
ncbi:alpha/beta fold hydrolase [Nonlabens agnitus]|uniref:Alpha/beta hydrolase n=1 Tax=Nonlabens agnitus TaxID=870484 RepID=A0A2S9WW55_9FLAO|nr:alpha/beta hydrolase [Nonlabens agnitus]PRP67709.1 alpha/beta hydrolase [Nonlabens agnitus]